MNIRAQALFGARAGEPLTLVDECGMEIGSAPLGEVHSLPGLRHRAFSVYLFDPDGQLLVHRRHAQKPLWGGHWANSCCSHPHHGEDTVRAAERRLREELGHDAKSPKELFAYEYRAEFEGIGVEHEWVHVFGRRAERSAVVPNELEMDAVRWLDAGAVDALIASDEPTAPWFELAWPRVRDALDSGQVT